MSSFNQITLVGNLTRDPQESFLPSQTPVCEFGLAVNQKFKGKDGQMRENTCFVDCKIFGPQASIFRQYVFKGHSVLVSGSLKFDQWTAQDGKERSKHWVHVDKFTFLEKAQPQERPAVGYEARPPLHQAPPQPTRPSGYATRNESLPAQDPDTGDLIPF